VKNIYTSVLAVLAIAFIITGFVFIKVNVHPTVPAMPYFGDADAFGSDDDALARIQYEWMMLHDPATGKIPAHIRDRELAFAANLPNDADLSKMSRTTSLAWQQRGPWNVGGRTRALAIDVTNENILIAGSCSGGMWRSIDQGTTWTPSSTASQLKSVSCVSQDIRAGHTNIWYYGTGEASDASASVNGAYYLGNGIYKSTDGGVTWNVLTSTVSSSVSNFDKWSDLIWNVVTDPFDTVHDVIYSAAYGGIYRSEDGGTTWTLLIGGFGGTSANSYFTDVAITHTGVVYASLSSDGSVGGIYRSVDTGTTFTNITPAGFPATYNRVKIGISPSNENQVYFLGNTPGYGIPDTNFQGDVEWNSFWRYTYISGDGSGSGGSWVDRSSNLPKTGGLFDKFTCQGSYDLVVKVKPNDTNTVFIGGTNIYRSTSAFSDNSHTSFIGGYQPGATLPVVALYPNHHPDQHELVFLPSNPNKMISGNDGGVFKTDDNTVAPVSWTPLNNGYLTTMFYSCAIDHTSTNDIVIGGAQDNGSWYTNSSSLTSPWVTPRGGDGSYCAIADNGAAYYFSIQNGKIMRAKLNASGGVDSFARIDPIGGHGYLFVNPYTIDPNNNNLMYMVAGTHLWRNNNLAGIPYASNWDTISTNWVQFPDSLTAGITYTSVAASHTPANRVYLGTSNRKVYRIDNANTGTPTKTDITSSIFPNSGGNSSATVSCIAIDPNNADNIIVAFSNYAVYSLFYSADGGTSFTKIAGNLEANIFGTGDGPSCRWVSIIPANGGNVYLVGTSIGLFATNILNGPSTYWIQLGANSIGNAVVDMMDYRSTDGLVVVATHSNGIYSSHITNASDVGVKTILLGREDLNFNNYPNPFSNSTTIHFSLKAKSDICLQIFDMSGRLINTLANQAMDPGEKNFQFSSGNLSSGIYYCTLKTNGSVQTRSLVVSK